jgi:pentatricopeptide repeat protein
MHRVLGNHDAVRACAEEMRASGVAPSAFVFTTLMMSLADQGQYERALSVPDSMLRAGVRPDAVFYNALLAVLHASRMPWHLCLAVLRRMRAGGVAPSVAHYNTLLLAAGDAADPTRAADLLTMMQADNVPPNAGTFAALLLVHARAGDWQRAVTVAEEAARQHVRMERAHLKSIGRVLSAAPLETQQAVQSLLLDAGGDRASLSLHSGGGDASTEGSLPVDDADGPETQASDANAEPAAVTGRDWPAASGRARVASVDGARVVGAELLRALEGAPAPQ